MMKRAPLLAKTGVSIPVDDLAMYAQDWLLDGEVRQLSSRTVDSRRDLVQKFLWFLQREGFRECGTPELRAFLAYLNQGHKEPGGRWGNPAYRTPVKPGTTRTYYNILRTLFRFLVEDGSLEASPMDHLRPPIARTDEIEPLSEEQARALIRAAKRSRNAKRDTAIVLLLLDAGLRASELTGLTVGDVEFKEKDVLRPREGR